LAQFSQNMDGPAVEDEKKPFDAENPEEEDSQPDPDEHLMLDQGNGRVWLVKVRCARHCTSQGTHTAMPPDP
jgi:hypothetical protein